MASWTSTCIAGLAEVRFGLLKNRDRGVKLGARFDRAVLCDHQVRLSLPHTRDRLGELSLRLTRIGFYALELGLVCGNRRLLGLGCLDRAE